MIFNNNIYETLVFRPLARTFSLFNSGSAVTSKSGSQTKMFSILCKTVSVSAV